MTTLAIDTSTSRGSVAVLDNGTIVLEENFTADRSHSASLFAVLERAAAIAPQLDQIAVGLGPGSYAGVRIAIAAALGLQLARGAELVGIPSVAALEVAASRYVAIGDARRETFYFAQVEDGVCTEGPLLVDAPGLHEKLATLGDALPILVPTPLPLVPHAQISLPSAAVIARLASETKGIIARGDLEPIYLREPHITQPRHSISLRDRL